MFKLKNLPLTISLMVVISLIVGWGISMVLAWTDPGAIPPLENVAAPINVSSTAQYKTGIAGFSTSGVDPNYGLTVGNNATYGIKSDRASWFGSDISIVGDITAVDEICLDDGCRSSWSSGGGADGNNYVTAISFSGTTTKTLTLSRSGLANLTATFTDLSGGITEEADTLDTVCDRGNTTNRTINTSGSVIASGEVRAGGNLVTSGDLVAGNNSWGSCYWRSYGYAAGFVKCDNGYYVAGIDIHNPWLVVSIYCCKL